MAPLPPMAPFIFKWRHQHQWCHWRQWCHSPLMKFSTVELVSLFNPMVIANGTTTNGDRVHHRCHFRDYHRLAKRVYPCERRAAHTYAGLGNHRRQCVRRDHWQVALQLRDRDLYLPKGVQACNTTRVDAHLCFPNQGRSYAAPRATRAKTRALVRANLCGLRKLSSRGKDWGFDF